MIPSEIVISEFKNKLDVDLKILDSKINYIIVDPLQTILDNAPIVENYTPIGQEFVDKINEIANDAVTLINYVKNRTDETINEEIYQILENFNLLDFDFSRPNILTSIQNYSLNIIDKYIKDTLQEEEYESVNAITQIEQLLNPVKENTLLNLMNNIDIYNENCLSIMENIYLPDNIKSQEVSTYSANNFILKAEGELDPNEIDKDEVIKKLSSCG